MNKIKKLVYSLAVIMIAVVAFSSCDNNEDALIVPCKEECFIHNKNLTRSTGIGTLRINPSQAVLGTSFQFTVWIPGSYPELEKLYCVLNLPVGIPIGLI